MAEINPTKDQPENTGAAPLVQPDLGRNNDLNTGVGPGQTIHDVAQEAIARNLQGRTVVTTIPGGAAAEGGRETADQEAPGDRPVNEVEGGEQTAPEATSPAGATTGSENAAEEDPAEPSEGQQLITALQDRASSHKIPRDLTAPPKYREVVRGRAAAAAGASATRGNVIGKVSDGVVITHPSLRATQAEAAALAKAIGEIGEGVRELAKQTVQAADAQARAAAGGHSGGDGGTGRPVGPGEGPSDVPTGRSFRATDGKDSISIGRVVGTGNHIVVNGTDVSDTPTGTHRDGDWTYTFGPETAVRGGSDTSGQDSSAEAADQGPATATGAADGGSGGGRDTTDRLSGESDGIDLPEPSQGEASAAESYRRPTEEDFRAANRHRDASGSLPADMEAAWQREHGTPWQGDHRVRGQVDQYGQPYTAVHYYAEGNQVNAYARDYTDADPTDAPLMPDPVTGRPEPWDGPRGATDRVHASLTPYELDRRPGDEPGAAEQRWFEEHGSPWSGEVRSVVVGEDGHPQEITEHFSYGVRRGTVIRTDTGTTRSERGLLRSESFDALGLPIGARDGLSGAGTSDQAADPGTATRGDGEGNVENKDITLNGPNLGVTDRTTGQTGTVSAEDVVNAGEDGLDVGGVNVQGAKTTIRHQTEGTAQVHRDGDVFGRAARVSAYDHSDDRPVRPSLRQSGLRGRDFRAGRRAPSARQSDRPYSERLRAAWRHYLRDEPDLEHGAQDSLFGQWLGRLTRQDPDVEEILRAYRQAAPEEDGDEEL